MNYKEIRYAQQYVREHADTGQQALDNLDAWATASGLPPAHRYVDATGKSTVVGKQIKRTERLARAREGAAIGATVLGATFTAGLAGLALPYVDDRNQARRAGPEFNNVLQAVVREMEQRMRDDDPQATFRDPPPRWGSNDGLPPYNGG